MTIDEAIELISAHINRNDFYQHLPETRAMLVGIEALKEVKASREEDYIGDTGLLPGETEE